MNEIKRGCIARCSLGMLGLVTSETKVLTRYGDQAWMGVQLLPEKAGHEWCSRNPTFVAESVQEIARLREERRWVPVGERLPELNEANYFRVYCLVYCKPGGVCEMTYEINTYAKHERHRQPRWKRHGMISMWEVTHWQPLPPGPEGEA